MASVSRQVKRMNMPNPKPRKLKFSERSKLMAEVMETKKAIAEHEDSLRRLMKSISRQEAKMRDLSKTLARWNKTAEAMAKMIFIARSHLADLVKKVNE